ncbi:MAG: lipocalin-like domain-containing protein [bacterium]
MATYHRNRLFPAPVLLTATALVVGCAPGDGADTDARIQEGDVDGGRLEASVLLGPGDTTGYARAVEPRLFEFPEDHGPHPDFRTEWWYLTGHLDEAVPGNAISGGRETARRDGSRRRFGYQFTLFRIALAPEAPEGSSDWRTNQAYMAHFALTDVEGDRFLSEERFARGALGLAGARADPFRAWLEDWSLGSVVREGTASAGDRAFPARLVAESDGFAVSLLLQRGKPPVLQGDRGLSPKGPGPGNASHYYSLTRMPTEGLVVLGPDTLRVEGASWMDREWSTSALGPGVEGWDWFALQLEGGRELMYYRLRREDGRVSPLSAGTWVERDGSHRRLSSGDVELTPLGWWESPGGGDTGTTGPLGAMGGTGGDRGPGEATGRIRYPVAWEMAVPTEELSVTLEPVLRDQEWRGAVRYWEGAMDVRGTLEGEDIQGRGYLEMTGYGGAVPGARSSP